jgi:gentisate 1,2-dioxygenase
MEKAERRVLALANPGHGRERMKVTASIYLGMQLLLPGELAPSHRHTPNTARLIVEGERAYTEVDGVKHFMSPGDLILTPSGMWHEHGHHGNAPVVWLDILDLPLVYELEAAYVEEGRGHGRSASSERIYCKSGVVPSPRFERNQQSHPIVRYPWGEIREALQRMAKANTGAEPLQVTYVNPETGEDCLTAIGFHAMMIRPGEAQTLPVRSCAAVFHVIEGSAEIHINELPMQVSRADTCCAPGFANVRLRNVDPGAPCFLFVADESPLQRKLGLYEIRSGSGRFNI